MFDLGAWQTEFIAQLLLAIEYGVALGLLGAFIAEVLR